MKYLLSILILFSVSLKKHDLGLKLEVGETYYQTSNAKINITQTISGIEQEIKMSVIGEMKFIVLEKSKDDYIMKTSYSSLTMSMNSAMGDMSFSSEDETGDVLSSIMKNMIGKSFTLNMNKNGTISSIENLDNVFSDMFSGFPEIPEAQKQQIFIQLKQAYGEKAFKGNIEMMTAIFPNRKVEIGENWQNSVKLESGMSGIMNNTFTLIELTEKNILIEGVSEITTEDKDAYADINGMKARYNMKGGMKSSLEIDPVTNWILSGNIELEMSGDVTIQDNPNLPGGLTIPMVMTTDMTIGQ